MTQGAGKLCHWHVGIDPRTKMLMVFMIGFASLNETRNIWQIAIFGIAVLMYFNNGIYRRTACLVAIYSAVLLYDIFIAKYMRNPVGLLIGVVLTYMRIFMPVFMLVKFMLRSTRVSEFVAAFDRMHMPNQIVIPFSVMFRFVPTITEEWRYIQCAMKYRGLSFNLANVITKPIETMEVTLVPLLANSVVIAEDLSAAALTRGLGADTRRTSITKVGMHIIDYILIVIMVFLVINSKMKGVL